MVRACRRGGGGGFEGPGVWPGVWGVLRRSWRTVFGVPPRRSRKSVAARVEDVRVETSVRLGQVKVDVGLAGLGAGKYGLWAAILRDGRRVKEFASKTFAAGDLVDGRLSFSEKWKPESLWDLNAPGNV